jgi:hypothetical protein
MVAWSEMEGGMRWLVHREIGAGSRRREPVLSGGRLQLWASDPDCGSGKVQPRATGKVWREKRWGREQA